MLVLLLIMFLCEKTTKYEEKSRTKSAKTAISGIFPAFSAGKKFFSKIGLGHVLNIMNTHLCAKNQKKLMIKSRENAKKPVFPAYFRHFRPEKNFFEHRAPSHFRYYYFASVCKISWKNIKYSSRNSRNTVFPAKIGCSGDF